MVDTGLRPNRLYAFDTKSKEWVANIVIPGATPQGGNSVRHMTYNRATRELWYGTDAGVIGKINIPKDIRKLTP